LLKKEKEGDKKNYWELAVLLGPREANKVQKQIKHKKNLRPADRSPVTDQEREGTERNMNLRIAAFRAWETLERLRGLRMKVAPDERRSKPG